MRSVARWECVPEHGCPALLAGEEWGTPNHLPPSPPLAALLLSTQVVPGLDEGLLTMATGGVRRLYIPGDLAFPKGLPSGELRACLSHCARACVWPASAGAQLAGYSLPACLLLPAGHSLTDSSRLTLPTSSPPAPARSRGPAARDALQPRRL